MAGQLTHAAINADDVPGAVAFYERVFGWSFHEYAPGFHRAELDGTVVAVQQRRELLPDVPTTGFECSLAVADVRATAAAIEAAGGRILMAPTAIPDVGEVCFFADPAGNVAGAISYIRKTP
ncbi:MAG: uncharacterized protein QOI80_3281 [Solirubrobacteraceae bacterium]|jgi:predicted enzyme related to lactoylglutathione lyase|nr:uncharacterized protein [Solirubrobacteraceae bacterium]